ncbi:MAG: Rieske (2Fe-2S) protein [Vulcanimicrobiaceae bacterium]
MAQDSQVLEGELLGTSVADEPVLLVRLHGVLHAIGRICTRHDDPRLADRRLLTQRRQGSDAFERTRVASIL